MRKIWISLGADGRVFQSTGFAVDGLLGPFDAPEGFEREQHLYRVENDALVKDEALLRANEAAKARAERDRRLITSDYLMLPDYPIDDAERTAVAAYRQALRDVSRQAGFPFNVAWPDVPVTIPP